MNMKARSGLCPEEHIAAGRPDIRKINDFVAVNARVVKGEL